MRRTIPRDLARRFTKTTASGRSRSPPGVTTAKWPGALWGFCRRTAPSPRASRVSPIRACRARSSGCFSCHSNPSHRMSIIAPALGRHPNTGGHDSPQAPPALLDPAQPPPGPQSQGERGSRRRGLTRVVAVLGVSVSPPRQNRDAAETTASMRTRRREVQGRSRPGVDADSTSASSTQQAHNGPSVQGRLPISLPTHPP